MPVKLARMEPCVDGRSSLRLHPASCALALIHAVPHYVLYSSCLRLTLASVHVRRFVGCGADMYACFEISSITAREKIACDILHVRTTSASAGERIRDMARWYPWRSGWRMWPLQGDVYGVRTVYSNTVEDQQRRSDVYGRY
jgi:hypothetical protein